MAERKKTHLKEISSEFVKRLESAIETARQAVAPNSKDLLAACKAVVEAAPLNAASRYSRAWNVIQEAVNNDDQDHAPYHAVLVVWWALLFLDEFGIQLQEEDLRLNKSEKNIDPVKTLFSVLNSNLRSVFSLTLNHSRLIGSVFKVTRTLSDGRLERSIGLLRNVMKASSLLFAPNTDHQTSNQTRDPAAPVKLILGNLYVPSPANENHRPEIAVAPKTVNQSMVTVGDSPIADPIEEQWSFGRGTSGYLSSLSNFTVGGANPLTNAWHTVTRAPYAPAVVGAVSGGLQRVWNTATDFRYISGALAIMTAGLTGTVNMPSQSQAVMRAITSVGESVTQSPMLQSVRKEEQSIEPSVSPEENTQKSKGFFARMREKARDFLTRVRARFQKGAEGTAKMQANPKNKKVSIKQRFLSWMQWLFSSRGGIQRENIALDATALIEASLGNRAADEVAPIFSEVVNTLSHPEADHDAPVVESPIQLPLGLDFVEPLSLGVDQQSQSVVVAGDMIQPDLGSLASFSMPEGLGFVDMPVRLHSDDHKVVVLDGAVSDEDDAVSVDSFQSGSKQSAPNDLQVSNNVMGVFSHSNQQQSAVSADLDKKNSDQEDSLFITDYWGHSSP